MTSLSLRPLELADAEALVQLAHRRGRNVHATEYTRFLRLEGASGLGVERDGALVGAITMIRYFEHGFLGPAIVDAGPDGAAGISRGADGPAGPSSVGLSLLLIGRAVEGLLRSGASYVECEATREEAPLLRPLGFETVRATLVMERPPAQARPSLATVALEAEHLLDVGILDADVVGYGRKGYLDALRTDHPEAARVLLLHGEVEGYVLARRSRNGYHLGPLVTRDAGGEHARDLLRDAVAPLATWPIVALAPEGSGLDEALRETGFRQVASLERMRAGRSPEPPGGGVATQWLLGGRITG